MTQPTLIEVLGDRARLEAAGEFERRLLDAFVGVEGNHHKIDCDELAEVFRSCSRTRLWEAGEPDIIEHWPFPIGVFRGVSGKGKHRRTRGLSWSTSLSAACWFATRYSLVNPEVFVAELSAPEIFAVVSRQSEREVIAQPERTFPVALGKQAMFALAQEYVGFCTEE